VGRCALGQHTRRQARLRYTDQLPFELSFSGVRLPYSAQCGNIIPDVDLECKKAHLFGYAIAEPSPASAGANRQDLAGSWGHGIMLPAQSSSGMPVVIDIST
jgi:hypothetical protein